MQNSELSNQSRKLLVQNSKLKKRLENLQRKFEYSEQKKNSVLVRLLLTSRVVTNVLRVFL